MSLLSEFRVLMRDLKARFRKGTYEVVRQKSVHGRQEYATDADLYSQQQLIEIAGKYHPEAIVVSEELDNFENVKFDGDKIVVIDPLDGTHNYMFGLPMWGVSYTLFSDNGVAVESYIGLPEADVLIAFVNDEIFHCSIEGIECVRIESQNIQSRVISEQLIAYDNQFYKDPINMKRHYECLTEHAFTTRITGSSVFDIAMIVLGRTNARIWHNVELYDIAPAFAFINRMGSLIALYSGDNATLNDRSIVATLDSSLHEQLSRIGIAIDHNI